MRVIQSILEFFTTKNDNEGDILIDDTVRINLDDKFFSKYHIKKDKIVETLDVFDMMLDDLRLLSGRVISVSDDGKTYHVRFDEWNFQRLYDSICGSLFNRDELIKI